MESKELFYILLIIILILNLLNKKETFVNLLNKKDAFLNSENKSKINIQQNKNKNIIRKQFQSNFKNVKDFYDKRYPFEKEPTGKNKPLVEQPERQKRLKVSITKKEYLPAFESKNNSIKNTGKPGFYIK
jgi:hypothetical protein